MKSIERFILKTRPRITFMGQSGFLLERSGTRILLDPRNKESGDLDGDLVYCTHKHFDHTGGVRAFMERNSQGILLGNRQVTDTFSEFGDRVKTVREGDSYELGPFAFSFKRLKHGVFTGTHNLGVELRLSEFAFAHCGDAVSFDEFPSPETDMLAIPISGVFAASPSKALKMVLALPEPPPTIIPMHWLMRNPQSFCKDLLSANPEAKCIVPTDGEPLPGYE